MRNAPTKTFSFPVQLTVEQLITDALLDALKARLPEGWSIRVLKGTDEQSRGDLELSRGEERVYVELKAEAYPGSLFPEPIQFWVSQPGHGTYRRSWAYTTTADFMLYLSTVTGMLMLAPRRPWLKTGVVLTEASLLQSVQTPSDPCRMYLTLNAGYLRGKSGRHFTGGAAGLGLATDVWLRAYDRLGFDVDGIIVCDGAELLKDARELVWSWTDEDIERFIRSRIGLRAVKDAREMTDVVAETRLWSEQPTTTETDDTRRIRNTLTELGAMPLAPDEELDALLAQMVRPLAADSGRALDDSMWFLAAASLHCGWARRKNAETDRVVEQARETRFRLDLRGLPSAAPVPKDMNVMDVRLPASYWDHGPRPGWAGVKDWLVLDDAARSDAQQRYLKAFRHAALPVGAASPVAA